MKNLLKNERGSEVIEFVILFPILIFLIFGAITFFLATYSKIIIADAAREGARAGALAANDASIVQVAEKRAKEVIDSAAVGALKNDETLNIMVSDDWDEAKQYKIVQVTIILALGSYQEQTRKSGSFGVWHQPQGYVSNFLVRPASS